jgi:hypothetical protein
VAPPSVFAHFITGGNKEERRKKEVKNKEGERRGTLLTKLNYYDTEKTIAQSETPREVLCPARQDSMLPEPFTTLSSGGSKNAGS